VEDFRAYLLSKQIVPEKKLVYHLAWVIQFYAFCDKQPGDKVSAEEIDSFLKHLMRSREDWQVNQANELNTNRSLQILRVFQKNLYYTNQYNTNFGVSYVQPFYIWNNGLWK